MFMKKKISVQLFKLHKEIYGKIINYTNNNTKNIRSWSTKYHVIMVQTMVDNKVHGSTM